MNDNTITQAGLESLLRKHSTKVRSGLRGMLEVMRVQFGGDIPESTLDHIEEKVMQELESGLAQMKLSIQEGI